MDTRTRWQQRDGGTRGAKSWPNLENVLSVKRMSGECHAIVLCYVVSLCRRPGLAWMVLESRGLWRGLGLGDWNWNCEWEWDWDLNRIYKIGSRLINTSHLLDINESTRIISMVTWNHFISFPPSFPLIGLCCGGAVVNFPNNFTIILLQLQSFAFPLISLTRFSTLDFRNIDS